MQSRFHPMFYVLLPLAVLGFATQFESILYSLAIPIAIIAVLFAAYYIMQKRKIGGGRSSYQRQAPPRQMRRPPEKTKPKRQTMPFRVIEGSKNKDDDDTPRYH